MIARPLNDYLRKDKKSDWLDPTTESLDTFNILKSKFVEPLLLALPRPHRPYMINTNASAYALGAVLLYHKEQQQLEWVGYNRLLETDAQSGGTNLLGSQNVVLCRDMGNPFTIPIDHLKYKRTTTLQA